MSYGTDLFTIGVEEEYLIVDPLSRTSQLQSLPLLEKAQEILGDRVELEMQQSQIEAATPICVSLNDVRRELAHQRRGLITAASQIGMRIASSGTHPFSHWKEQQITPKYRYQNLLREYQQLTREQNIQGCHVHVGLTDRDLGIKVMNRARNWLAPLLALSANSPFWLGEETGYASYRTEIWSRWPTSGPPHLFTSYAEYELVLQDLVATRVIDDATKIYWDLRLSSHFDTIEFRVADICLTVDEAVMIAGLIRALVRTCVDQIRNGIPFSTVRLEMLRVSHWRAARYGLEGDLVDVVAQQVVPARELVYRFLSFVRPALEEEGDWEEIARLVEDVLQRGNGAMRQRDVYRYGQHLEDVVDFIVTETAKEGESVPR
jgi:carboxylate-amine ligase